jgi:hypothetical protein
MRAVRARVLPASIIVLVAIPAVARAQSNEFEDPYDVPTAPRPPTLPELTHSEIEGTLETTAGALIPTAGGVWTHAYVQRLAIEVPLALRRWYVGTSYEVAAGGTASTFKAVGGNLALEGRTVWATQTGLAFGGGMALMLPTASYGPGTDGAVVALNAATLRPWDLTYFTPGVVGLRPYVDVRALLGPFIAQFRQGLDVTVSPAEIGQRNLYATTGVYFGWAATSQLAVGLEAFEAYAIQVQKGGLLSQDVHDGERAALVVSPNVRLSLPWVQPAISMFTNVGTPLFGANESMWGFRFAFTVVYDPNATLKVRTATP